MKSTLPFTDLLNLPSMTICTAAPPAIPHAASVYFVADDHLSLYFLSATSSQHVRDLALNPLAAVTIEPLVERWQEIRGLQMRGSAAEIPNGFQSAAGWALTFLLTTVSTNWSFPWPWTRRAATGIV